MGYSGYTIPILTDTIIITSISYEDINQWFKYKIGEIYEVQTQGQWFEGPNGQAYNRIAKTNDYIFKKDCTPLSEFRENKLNQILDV